jgi:MSHA biogenesis protein MshI
MFGLLKKSSAAKCRVGVAFGAAQVAIAVVRRDRGAPVLERCELLPIAADAGADASSAVLRAAALPRAPVSTVLRTDDYQLVLVEAPDVPPAELRAAMRWRLKESIDYRVEDAVIDVFDVPAQARGGHGRMMYAIAARRTAVERHVSALAGVSTFDVVDVPELCLRNLAALTPAAAGGVAMLHLSEKAATIVLVKARTFYFARQMDLQATLRLAAGSDPDARLDVAGFVLELQRSLDYYERHFDQPPITRIVVSPGSARGAMLADDLAKETGFEVDTLNLRTLLQCEIPSETVVDATSLLAVGAALREEHRSL